MLESGAWGAQDAGPIVRKIFDAWLAAKGAAAPADTPLATPASAPTSASGSEDIPVEDASALPPPASSTDGGTP